MGREARNNPIAQLHAAPKPVTEYQFQLGLEGIVQPNPEAMEKSRHIMEAAVAAGRNPASVSLDELGLTEDDLDVVFYWRPTVLKPSRLTNQTPMAYWRGVEVQRFPRAEMIARFEDAQREAKDKE